MFWLRDLGSMIEHYKGMIFLAVLILISAVVSNVAQYLIDLARGRGGCQAWFMRCSDTFG